MLTRRHTHIIGETNQNSLFLAQYIITDEKTEKEVVQENFIFVENLHLLLSCASFCKKVFLTFLFF